MNDQSAVQSTSATYGELIDILTKNVKIVHGIVAEIDFMFKGLQRCIMQSKLFDQIDFTILHVKNIAAPVRSSLRGGRKLCVSELCPYHERKWIPRV